MQKTECFIKRSLWLYPCIVMLFIGCFTSTAFAQDEPALPPGLNTNPSDAPALPPGLGDATDPEQLDEEIEGTSTHKDALPDWLHGFWETRMGMRTHNDPQQPGDLSMGESRLQLEGKKFWGDTALEFTADLYGDLVAEEVKIDLRQLRLTFSPMDTMDIRIGRQVLTWGTGDLLFINDLFPKDWQSYFLGRDQEYLKAPSDAIKVGWYPEWLKMELVYTPRFDRDRFIRGERVTYFSPFFGPSGQSRQVQSSPPNTWFGDDEIALRLYRRLNRFEVAAYAYHGYWKSPAGQRMVPFEATHPRLNVYGASLRGTVGKGLLNMEFGYYDSRDDRDGSDFMVNNSELRFLIGYEQELGKEFTGTIQYYVEHMLDYDNYARSPFLLFFPKWDENRHLITLRLTKLLMDQNLVLSFFTYYSPSDNDAYLRPKATYKMNDQWTVEGGANIFLGREDHSFFGQFEATTNVYASVRYSF